MTTAITSVSLPSLTHLTTGKVRELFFLDDKSLLFVSTDRISAYDVVLTNAIPSKGTVLTLTSAHWFRVLSAAYPTTLHTHVISLAPPAILTPTEKSLIAYRSMTVRKLKIFPIEAIVRGYISGSAWAEYQKRGTVHGIKVPSDLKQSSKLPEPLFTPSTKAEIGQKDENIHPSAVAGIVGEKYAKRIEELALSLYKTAAAYALKRGIIIADTKFEFALDEETDEVVLADEVLTPDSSRFWPADKYEEGRDQESFDKQFVRNYLVKNGLKGKEGVTLPEDIVKATEKNYKDVYERLTGEKFEDALKKPLV